MGTNRMLFGGVCTIPVSFKINGLTYSKLFPGFTQTILKPTEGPSLPERYGVGLVRLSILTI
jgi:hypothetical protein